MDPSSTRKSKHDNGAGAIFAKTTPMNLATNYIRTAPRCTGNMLTFAPLTTVYDSMYVLDSLTKNLKRMGRQRAPQKRNLKRKRDLKDVTGEVKINTAIWKNIQKNPIRLRIQHLFFKSIHKTHKIGRYWLNILADRYSQRTTCRNCDDDETMNHVLIECTHLTTRLLARETQPMEKRCGLK